MSGRTPLQVATHLAPGVLPAYALAARRIGERLERPAELIVAADYDRCVADIDDVCFVCSIPYVLLSDAGRIAMTAVAAPVLRGRRYGGRPIYFSDVIVRADSPYHRFDDLAGTRWAYNEPFSHSGFGVALHRLASRGVPASFVGEWVEAGFHDDAIQYVLDGRADWAAIDSQVLEIWQRQQPALRRQLRVVEVLGPSTIQPVVVSTSRLTTAERALVLGVLLDLHRDPIGRTILRSAGIDHFVPVGDADYSDIRSMLAVVRESGWLPSWWEPRWDAIAGERVSAETSRSAPPAAPAHAGPRRSSPPPSQPPS